MPPEVLQDDFDGEATSAPPPPPKNRGPRTEESMAAVESAREDDRNVWDWLREFSGAGTLRLKLERKWPKEWLGHPIAGFCEEYDEPFDEKQILSRFGGGRFQVKAQRPNPKGGWVYAGAKTFEIAGDPKVPETTKVTLPLPLPKDEDEGLASKALDAAQRSAEMNQRRAWQLEDEMRKGQGTDPALLSLITNHPQVKILQEQVTAITKLLSEKDQKIFDLVTRKPEQGLGEKLAEKIIDGESARIDALRVQHDAELRQLRTSHEDALKRIEDRMQREMESRERAHERELRSLHDSHASQTESLKQAYEARLDGIKGRLTDLERQLTEAKSEVVELRSRKEKSFSDSIQEIATTKNALEGLGLIGGGDTEPPSVIERILAGVMNSPIMGAVANRVENAPPAPPPPQARPRRAEGGPPSEGGVPQAPRKVRRPQPAPQPGDVVLNPNDVATAIGFLESAILNGTDPEAFAQSARTMVPGPILDVIRTHGVDKFLDSIPLDGNSVLRSQRGRNFARAVARVLVSGSVEAPPPSA